MWADSLSECCSFLLAALLVLDRQMTTLPDWNRAFGQLALLMRSVLNCQMIQHNDWIVFRRRARLSLNAWNTCCPKRLVDLLRRKIPPIQHNLDRLPMPPHRRFPQKEFRPPRKLAEPVHRKLLLELLRPKNPIAHRRQLINRRQDCPRLLKVRLGQSDRTCLPKLPMFPHSQLNRIGL